MTGDISVTSKAGMVSAAHSTTLYANAPGRKIAYRTIGKGFPMILCNRFRGNQDDWDPAFLDELAKKYQVITFNYTGMASSSGTPATTVLGFAQDVKDLAEALGIQKAILCGWSTGGFVAQVAITEFENLFTHAILIGTKPPGNVRYGIEQIFKDTAYKPKYTVEDETILFFEPAAGHSVVAAHESHERIAARSGDKDPVIGEELWKYYAACVEDFAKDPYDCLEKLKAISTPILVISSDHEVCFPPENWFELNRKLPTTQIIVIPESGHGVQHQYPEMVARYIHSFLITTGYTS